MAERKKGFDLAAVLGDVSKLDTGNAAGREQIEYIDIDLIDDDPNNFYEISELDSLAANIELIGLQQPIRVRANPNDPGRVTIVSGHRRRAAIRKLVADGRDDLREIPCIRDQQPGSDALKELRLIYANSDTRRMSSADIGKQAQRVEALLYQLKEEGYEFPGRMRDHVAEACKVSKTKLARLKVIRENLVPCWQPAYEKNDLAESVAYALAQLPAEHQQCIFEGYKTTSRNVRWLYEGSVKTYEARLVAIDKLTCKKAKGEPCSNLKHKQMKAMHLDTWADCSCSKCCDTCKDLATCKSSCSMLADKVKKLKADAKEAKRQEKLAQEEKDRPAVEKLQALWMRFGYARECARKTAKEVYKAADMYYAKGDDEKMDAMERCEPNFNPNTTLPYGYSCRLSDVQRLINVADLFGCSIDYLLCRTDVRETAQTSPEKEEKVSDSGTWNVGEPTVPGDYILLMRHGHCPTRVEMWEWNGGQWVDDTSMYDPDVDGEILGWIPMPER